MGTHPIFESDFDCLTEMNSTVGSISALLSQTRSQGPRSGGGGDDGDQMPHGVLLIGGSMVRNIRAEFMDAAQVIKFAYPGITGKHLQNQFNPHAGSAADRQHDSVLFDFNTLNVLEF